MNKLLLYTLVPLTFATMSFAKLGETRADATARWSNVVKTSDDGQMITYDANNYFVVQIYGKDDDAPCIAALYYRKEGGITKEQAAKIDVVNVPNVNQIKWHEVDSGAEGIKQWNSADNKLAVIGGQVTLNGKSLTCRGYITPEGMAYFKETGMLGDNSEEKKGPITKGHEFNKNNLPPNDEGKDTDDLFKE
jgi:hypothetical protein